MAILQHSHTTDVIVSSAAGVPVLRIVAAVPVPSDGDRDRIVHTDAAELAQALLDHLPLATIEYLLDELEIRFLRQAEQRRLAPR